MCVLDHLLRQRKLIAGQVTVTGNINSVEEKPKSHTTYFLDDAMGNILEYRVWYNQKIQEGEEALHAHNMQYIRDVSLQSIVLIAK
jgi:hypothetical protein